MSLNEKGRALGGEGCKNRGREGRGKGSKKQ